MPNPEYHFPSEELSRLLASLNQEATRLDYQMSRELPLPAVLYHATPRRNLNSISQVGLEPRPLYFSSDKVICLSDDPFFALRTASEMQGIRINQLALLAIDKSQLVPSEVENYLRKEDPNNPDLIEAQALHEVHYREVVSSDVLTDQRFKYDETTGTILLKEGRPLVMQKVFHKKSRPYNFGDEI